MVVRISIRCFELWCPHVAAIIEHGFVCFSQHFSHTYYISGKHSEKTETNQDKSHLERLKWHFGRRYGKNMLHI